MQKEKILHLTLKKKWFDLIASGKKKIEYRECKPYWIKRLTYSRIWHAKHFDKIIFKNGYNKNAPTIEVQFNSIDLVDAYYHKPENGEELNGGLFFAIKLGEIIK